MSKVSLKDVDNLSITVQRRLTNYPQSYRHFLLWIGRTISKRPLSVPTHRDLQNKDQVNFGFKIKNIDTPQKIMFFQMLKNSAEILIKRMRWKTFHFMSSHKPETLKESQVLDLNKPAPKMTELEEFEDRMTLLINNIKFKKGYQNVKPRNTKEQVKNKRKETVVVTDKETDSITMTRFPNKNIYIHNEKKADESAIQTDTRQTKEHEMINENMEEKGQHKRTRKRKVIWFNPPFSLNVSTQIGAEFLKIVDQSFPKSNHLNKIFNRNTLKISYITTQI